MINRTESNFTLDGLGSNSASITIRGWCDSCEAGGTGPHHHITILSC
jgi:hypothetical protein